MSFRSPGSLITQEIYIMGCRISGTREMSATCSNAQHHISSKTLTLKIQRLSLKPLDFDEIDDKYIVKQNLIDNKEVAKLRFYPCAQTFAPRHVPNQKHSLPSLKFNSRARSNLTSLQFASQNVGDSKKISSRHSYSTNQLCCK